MTDEQREDTRTPNWPRLLADATLEGVLIHEDGRILQVNAALARMLGCAPEAMVGMSGVELAVEPDRPRLLRHIAEGAEHPIEGTALRADGTTFPCEIRGRTVADGGRTLRVVLVRDVSERVAMMAALRRRERELATLAEHSPDVITRYDRDDRVRFMSGAVERATGVPAAWYVGRRLGEFDVPAELLRRWTEINRRVFATGQAEEAEFEFVGPDGVRRWYHTRVVPERDDAGAVEHVLTTTRDLTALRAAEGSAREAYATLRGVIDQSLTGICVVQDGRLVYANARFAEIFGFAGADELLALPGFAVLVHPDDRPMVAERVRRRIAGDPPAGHLAFRGVRRDGGVIHVEVHGSVAEHAGSPAMVGTLIDVTERRQLEERLAQGRKMEALGQLAGGVAHDFNNVLAAITGFGELVAASLAPGTPAAADMQQVLLAAERAAALVRQLLAFSRRETLALEVVDLAAVVRDLGRMLERLLPARIALRLPPADVRAPVRATRAQLEQIVVNLAVNARDAMPDGGTLSLDVRTEERDGAACATLEARDTGCGMSPEVRARALEPFFTTKHKDEGTGLGLATVYGLVTQFGGEIDIASAPGAGTAVTISLPAAPPPAAREPARPTPPTPPDRGGARPAARGRRRERGRPAGEGPAKRSLSPPRADSDGDPPAER